jgi:hypothetical protein
VKEIMEIFRAPELTIDTKISVIEKLGRALDDQFGMNWTKEITDELIGILEDAKAQIKEDAEREVLF